MDSIIAQASLTLTGMPSEEARQLPAFPGRDHWFSSTVQTALSMILSWKQTLALDDALDTWYQFSLSRIINRVSRQDSETRYVAREKHFASDEVAQLFVESLGYAKVYLKTRGPLVGSSQAAWADSSTHIPIADGSVDCVITSPPYANTMDYYLYHKQRMNILGYDFKGVQNTEIGSRWEYSSLKKPLSQWNDQYKNTLSEIRRILRENATCVIIIGDSQIAGTLVDAAELTADLSSTVGFCTLSVTSTNMTERSRSFSRAFQRPHKREHIIALSAV
ncbi:MAG TPA: DNA methyltransferase [Candidatus Rubrimentiphilum sp.]|nr:DNA methyltransferase [Candidatus Rubrimentiphilum sp.]